MFNRRKLLSLIPGLASVPLIGTAVNAKEEIIPQYINEDAIRIQKDRLKAYDSLIAEQAHRDYNIEKIKKIAENILFQKYLFEPDHLISAWLDEVIQQARKEKLISSAGQLSHFTYGGRHITSHTIYTIKVKDKFYCMRPEYDEKFKLTGKIVIDG